MSSELLEQAAALRDLIEPARGVRPNMVHFEAAVVCAERLNLAGYPEAALELVESVLLGLPEEGGAYRLRLEIQALRALVLCYRDSHCLERALKTAAELASLERHYELDYAYLCVFEPIALLRM